MFHMSQEHNLNVFRISIEGILKNHSVFKVLSQNKIGPITHEHI